MSSLKLLFRSPAAQTTCETESLNGIDKKWDKVENGKKEYLNVQEELKGN